MSAPMGFAEKWQVIRSNPLSFTLKLGMAHILLKTGLSRFFPIRFSNFKIKLSPTALSRTLWVNPADRHAEEEFFKAYLKSGDVVVDIGANIGCLALTASWLVGPTGRVYSFEAHPRTYRYLLENLAYNATQNVVATNKAMGETRGSIRFSDKSDDSQNQVSDHGGIETTMIPLDECEFSQGPIQLLKIDVEGYELPVLKGAIQTLKNVDCIYYESWQEHMRHFKYSNRDVYTLLASSGFRVYRIEGTSLVAIDADYISKACENLVGFRDESKFMSRTGWRIQNYSALKQAS